jgi:aspartate kinase
MSRIVVQKFGGSSVADVEKIRRVAERVKARRDAGWQVVVVVSAMGDTTDELLQLAKKVSAAPPRRELDMLLTCGERISMALLSMALHELGVSAKSFTGSQSGIITDDAHAQARIIEVRPARIEEELGAGKVVIVAGYQGVSTSKEITTLGRGGSDTTAVALAAALGADCEIYSDVDGVFSADPRHVPGAKKLEEISFDEMQALAEAGAKVLNSQAVEFAKARGITIAARSTHGEGTGTRVQRATSGRRVSGVTAEDECWVLVCAEGLAPVLPWLRGHEVRVRATAVDAAGQALVVVPLHDLHDALALKTDLPPEISLREDLGTVTCVGTGLATDISILERTIIKALELKIPVTGVYASGVQLTLIVPRSKVRRLTLELHAALVA